MTKEQQEQFESIIYDKNARVEFIEKTYVTASSLPYLEKSVYSFILNKLFPEPQTAAMKFGSALHMCVIEGVEKYLNSYVIMPKELSALNKNTKLYKEGYEALQTEANGREILTYDEHEQIIDMQSAFYNSEIYEEVYKEPIQELLKEEMIEFVYNDVKCRGRLDIATKFDENWTVWDLKTTQDTLDLDSISKSINNYKYYRQMEMYRMAIVSRYNMNPEVKLIFLGKEFPFLPVCVEQLSERYWETARTDIFFLTEKWRDFMDNKDYATIQDKYQSHVKFDAPLWLKSVGVY